MYLFSINFTNCRIQTQLCLQNEVERVSHFQEKIKTLHSARRLDEFYLKLHVMLKFLGTKLKYRSGQFTLGMHVHY